MILENLDFRLVVWREAFPWVLERLYGAHLGDRGGDELASFLDVFLELGRFRVRSEPASLDEFVQIGFHTCLVEVEVHEEVCDTEILAELLRLGVGWPSDHMGKLLGCLRH